MKKNEIKEGFSLPKEFYDSKLHLMLLCFLIIENLRRNIFESQNKNKNVFTNVMK